jgi:hypothetical protein
LTLRDLEATAATAATTLSSLSAGCSLSISGVGMLTGKPRSLRGKEG